MHLNTGCSLAVSIAVSVVSAAPLALPLNTLSPTAHLWVTGILGLLGVALNGYRVWLESQGHEPA